MKYLLSFLFALYLSSSLQAQIAFRCVAVASSGDVTLSWLPIPDPLGEFKNYQIYKSADNITFIPLTAPAHITNRLQTNYTYNEPLSLTQPMFYKMVVEFASAGTPYYPHPDSDTLASMFVVISNSVPVEDGYAHLAWNPMHDPPMVSTAPTYDIYRKYNLTDPWVLIGNANVGSEIFDDLNKICQDTPFYKIEVSDLSGCKSISIEANSIVIDNKAPDAPTVDSVSVDINTNDINFSWVPDMSVDLGGFIIVRDGAIAASLSNPALQTYTDVNANPDQNAVCYSVASTDNCLIQDPPSPPSYNTSPALYTHCTVYLQAVAFNCEKRIQLNWTSYKGWGTDLVGYDLYVQTNSGAWTKKVSMPSNQLSYSDTGLILGTTYCYFIRAKHLNTSVTSSSNSVCLKTSDIQKPNALYISCLNVEDNEVYISFYVPTPSEATGYRILRSHRLDTAFVTVTDIQPSNVQEVFKWKDDGLGTDSVIYHYVVVALDSCDNPYFYSDTVHTILLQGTSYPHAFYNELYWNAYQGFSSASGEVKEYVLYVSYDSKSNFVEEKSMGNSQVFYTHQDLDDYLSTNGEFCYYLSAVEDTNKNIYGLKEVCNSNVKCLSYQDLVWIPNVFTPDRDKINDVFKPVSSFIDAVGYEFIIYNRWGQVVFETKDKDAGWDAGVFESPIGYYSYYLKYRNPYYLENKDFVQKEFIIRRGSFLLLR